LIAIFLLHFSPPVVHQMRKSGEKSGKNSIKKGVKNAGKPRFFRNINWPN